MTFKSIATQLKDLLTDVKPGRAALLSFVIFGHVAQAWIADRNLINLDDTYWNNVLDGVEKYGVKPFQFSLEKFETHKETERFYSFRILGGSTSGVIFKTIKFLSNYYNFIWRLTEGNARSPKTRIALFVVIDTLVDAVQFSLTYIAEAIIINLQVAPWPVHRVIPWATLMCLYDSIMYAVTYYPIPLLHETVPGVKFTSLFAVKQLLHGLAIIISILWNSSSKSLLSFPAYDLVNETCRETSYPIGRVIVTNSISGVTNGKKEMGVKFYNLGITNYIFVSYSLLDKLPPDEVAALVRHELGHWKSSLYLYSHLKLACSSGSYLLVGFIFDSLQGKLFLKNIFRLDPDVPEVVPVIVLSGFLGFSLDAVYNLIVGSLEARAIFRADDFVRRSSVDGGSALSRALASQMVADMGHSSMFDSWFARIDMKEPTVWERLERLS